MIPCNIPVSFGEMVSIHRLRRKMSQTELAQAVGISRNYISQIERGNENVSYDVMQKICTALDLEIRIGTKVGDE